MQKPGKSGRGRGLADMSGSDQGAQADAWEYKRPGGAELTLDMPITLGHEAPGQSVYVVQWTYRGKVVDFALTQRIERTAGTYEHIARFDCCHSEVHKHQFREGGRELQRTVVAPINDQSTSWDLVDEKYEECSADMFDRWHENYRRWKS